VPFKYSYTIRFQDTDAAGVVYFANILSICHIAYEASLIAGGISLPALLAPDAVSLPIVSTAANFLAPLHWGDAIEITLTPAARSAHKFEIDYRITLTDTDTLATTATTTHLAIDRRSRSRQDIPANFRRWLELYGGGESD
jgi:1,4-dihydroxy-2-naphthoyl-CoA hydrolase